MVATLKIGLVVNAAIGPEIASGPGQEGYEVAMDLYKKDKLGKVFCLSVTDNCELPKEKTEQFCQSGLKHRLIGILNRVHKRHPIVRGRRRVEQWVDGVYARKLRREDCDVLYSPKPLYPKTFKRARQLGIKVIAETSVLHPRFNLEIVNAEKERLAIRGAAGYTDEVRVRNIECALAEADRIFTWNAFVRDSYVKYGIPEAKFLGNMNFSPPGIDTEKFSPGPKRNDDVFKVLHVSAISVIKGVQYLLDAWERIQDEIGGELHLVGPVDRDMNRILKTSKVKNMIWHGSSVDPVNFFRDASIFVSPSISDAGPRTVLESMSCGVPAVVSDHCGVSEIITPKINGFVYHYNDVDELSSILKWCGENREQLLIMGQHAREQIQGFNVKNYSKEIEERISAIATEAQNL